eukprot:TRINITY_DN2350_c0_g2_i10.p1 TRINITY_DN2350_c0_g2~~TRINITY_DN2350_c0_g2_i10.p1  ORF type:complete len:425 (+),score=74.85 TRINITY_DN2350_c0_g2_i10:104-1276(+)
MCIRDRIKSEHMNNAKKIQIRGKSNPKKEAGPTDLLEQESLKMVINKFDLLVSIEKYDHLLQESRLRELRQVMDQEAEKRAETGTGSRWRTNNDRPTSRSAKCQIIYRLAHSTLVDSIPNDASAKGEGDKKKFARGNSRGTERPPSSERSNKISSREGRAGFKENNEKTATGLSGTRSIPASTSILKKHNMNNSVTANQPRASSSSGQIKLGKGDRPSNSASRGRNANSENSQMDVDPIHELEAKIGVSKSTKVEEVVDLQSFLDELKLGLHYNKFADKGIVDLEALMGIEREQLAEIGVPTGHQIKIMKGVEKLRETYGSRGAGVDASDDYVNRDDSTLENTNQSFMVPLDAEDEAALMADQGYQDMIQGHIIDREVSGSVNDLSLIHI